MQFYHVTALVHKMQASSSQIQLYTHTGSERTIPAAFTDTTQFTEYGTEYQIQLYRYRVRTHHTCSKLQFIGDLE